MEQSVYVNLSVVDLKPAVLNFLSDLAEAAKESVFVTRIKDLAAKLGRDTRTIQRYLKELTAKEILEMKGKKGRAGGTVIRFNSDLIQFTTSDRALINSEEPVDIDELLQTKIPKKKKEVDPNKRPRRTKTQMAEARLLQDEKQAKIDELNDQLGMLGGVPSWDWFKKTDDPVGNYRTYLLSRLYNRYAALYIDRHNARVLVMKQGDAVNPISNGYDVLGNDKILGTSRWAQFEKFRLFCEENSIDPAAYLTAQFNRSTLITKGKDPGKILPFVNALTSDASYAVYRGYHGYNERKDSMATFYGYLPHEFASDFVVQAICNAYETADKELGLLEFRSAIVELLKESPDQEERASVLADYYYHLLDDMKEKNVPKQAQSVIKKHYVTQALVQTTGSSSLPKDMIIGSEVVQFLLSDLTLQASDLKEARAAKEIAIGKLLYPNVEAKKQVELGKETYYQLVTLTETHQLLRLIQERKGLSLSLNEVRKALQQYDKTKIPSDEFSMLDVDQIIEKCSQIEQAQSIDLEEITEREKIVLHGSVKPADDMDNLLKGLKL